VSEIWGTDVNADITRLESLVREASLEQGLTFCAEYIKAYPERGEGFFFAGLLNYRVDKLGQAMEMMAKAHELAPDVREFALVLASMHAKSNHLNDALYFAKVGAANEPNPLLDQVLPEELRDFIASTMTGDPQKHYVQAMISYNLRKFAEAVQECEQELKLNNRFAPAYELIGKALLKLGHIERALMAFRAVVDINEGRCEDGILTRLAECYLRLGQSDEARAALSTLFEKADISVKTLATVTRLRALAPEGEWGGDWSEVDAFCKQQSDRLLEGLEPFFPATDRADDRIRVGFLTDKAYQCLEGLALEVFAKRYDRALFDCFLYVQNVVQDPVTHGFYGHMKGVRNVFDVDDKTLSLIIQRDGIDVLIDMCGYGEDQRLNLIAHKPAHTHVSWLASPAVDEQPGIDCYWREIQAGNQVSYPLVTVPLALESLTGYGAVTSLPAREQGGVTFGARLDLTYITPEIVAVWGDLLSQIEGARLRLGLVEDISSSVINHLMQLLEPAGIFEKVILHTPENGVILRGAFFRDTDIFLGQPTADTLGDFVDALWCGVPCLSMPLSRQTFVTGRDIVSMVGATEWNAVDGKGFVAQGVALSSDLDQLEALRAGLRERVERSTLLNGEAFAGQVQGALVHIVNQSRANREAVR